MKIVYDVQIAAALAGMNDHEKRVHLTARIMEVLMQLTKLDQVEGEAYLEALINAMLQVRHENPGR